MFAYSTVLCRHELRTRHLRSRQPADKIFNVYSYRESCFNKSSACGCPGNHTAGHISRHNAATRISGQKLGQGQSRLVLRLSVVYVLRLRCTSPRGSCPSFWGHCCCVHKARFPQNKAVLVPQNSYRTCLQSSRCEHNLLRRQGGGKLIPVVTVSEFVSDFSVYIRTWTLLSLSEVSLSLLMH